MIALKGLTLAVAFTCLSLPLAAETALASSEAERFEAAEALRKGDPPDLQTSLAAHLALIEEGYTRSLVSAASIYMDLGELAKAREAYAEAANRGDTYAAVKLAVGDAKSEFGDASDPAGAVAMLEELAEDPENDRAIYALADLYYRGESVEPDAERAFALFKPLADSGSRWAQSRIGDLALSGRLGEVDAELAATYYRSAVENGHDRARVNLTEALIAAGRHQDALDVIDQAVLDNVKGAELKRARWHIDGAFGSHSDRPAGAKGLAALVDEGDIYAARVASYLFTDDPRLMSSLDVERMFSVLEQAGREGDNGSLRAVARAYRRLDGRLPRMKARHSTLIEELGSTLDDRARAVEEVFAAYDMRDHRGSRERAAVVLENKAGDAFAAGMMELRGIERTAFVYVVQKELAQRGLYSGRQHGRLTKRTIRAILDFCRQAGIIEECRNGPISKDASALIVEALGSAKMVRETSG